MKEFLSAETLEVDIDETLLSTTYVSYFVKDPEGNAQFLRDMVQEAVDYLKGQSIVMP